MFPNGMAQMNASVLYGSIVLLACLLVCSITTCFFVNHDGPFCKRDTDGYGNPNGSGRYVQMTSTIRLFVLVIGVIYWILVVAKKKWAVHELTLSFSFGHYVSHPSSF